MGGGGGGEKRKKLKLPERIAEERIGKCMGLYTA